MSLVLNIKVCFSILFYIIMFDITAQNTNSGLSEQSENTSYFNVQKSISFTVGISMPSVMENSNFGKATEERLGFEIGVQVFVYQGLFLGFFHNSSYFEISNQDLLGRYDETSVAAYYLKLGYELQVLKNFTTTLSIAPLGNARYKNIIDRDRIKQQIDDANIMIYEFSLAYDFSRAISAFLQYSYRVDNTKIQTAAEISNDFNKISYHNFGLGLRIHLGRSSLF